MSNVVNGTKEKILRVLKDTKSIYEIGKSMKLSYSTTHKHIKSLVDNGFVSRISKDEWKISEAGLKFLTAIDDGRKGQKAVLHADKKGKIAQAG